MGETQVEEAFAASQLLLHGRQVPRMLQDHHCFQSCTNCCSVRWLLHSSLSAHWWPSKAHRRMLLQEEATLKIYLRPPTNSRVGTVTRLNPKKATFQLLDVGFE